MKDQKLFEIVVDVLRRMYKKATPSADLDKLMKSGETKKPRWFMRYYLAMEMQQEILNDELKKYKLTDIEKRKIENTVWLGASPSCVREA